MDVTLHKRCAKFVYVIPEGLRELMSDISREVIRSQPEQLYHFIADYLDALMITRENARVAARLVDSIVRIAAMTVELLQQTGMAREAADKMATIIQESFKRYLALRREPVVYTCAVEEEEEEHNMIINIMHQYGDLYNQENSAAIIIQKAFREFKERQARERQLLTGMIDWRVAARSAIYLYRRSGATVEEANRAATLIKAAYKGYYTRRIMRRLVAEGQQIYGERGEEASDQYSVSDEAAEEEATAAGVRPEEAPSRSSAVAVTVLRGMLDDVVSIGRKRARLEGRPETPPPTEATDQLTETIYDATITITEPAFPEDQEWMEETGWYELPPDELRLEGEQTTVTEPISAEGAELEGHEMEMEG